MGFGEWLNGKKSYLVMIGTLIYAFSGALLGRLEWTLALGIIAGVLGFGAARSATKKLE